jgi:hypothetical protein
MSNNTSTTRNMVQFSEVEIIEIPITLGDNPSCKSGPAIQPSWDTQSRSTVDLDWYELSRPNRRRSDQLVLSATERIAMLINSGFQLSEIETATAMSPRVRRKKKNSRQRSSSSSSRRQKHLEAMNDQVERLFEQIARLENRMANAQ